MNKFSDWISFGQIEKKFPKAPGLFQVKVKGGLLSYPKGKSAMFYYGYTSNLHRGAVNFRSKILPLLEVNEEALLIRWMSVKEVEAKFQLYLNTFYKRFGSLPLGNEMLLKKTNQR